MISQSWNKLSNDVAPLQNRASCVLQTLHPWLADTLAELGRFGSILHAIGCVPGNGGDISVLIPDEVQKTIQTSLPSKGRSISFDGIPTLAAMRRDRGPYYRAEGIDRGTVRDSGIAHLGGRQILATVSGAKIWDLCDQADRRLCILRVEDDASGFQLLYGPEQYGTVPTTEFVNHLMAHAANAGEPSVVLHAHPQCLTDLSRHPMAAEFRSFNRHLYAQRPELLANIPKLLGFVPYCAPGSKALVQATVDAICAHNVVMWQAHGLLVREASLERCVDLLEYAETSADSAIRNLMLGQSLRTFSREELRGFVEAYQLDPAVLSLFN